jgi:hypothetical protein
MKSVGKAWALMELAQTVWVQKAWAGTESVQMAWAEELVTR